jgi:hypothetical protein
LAARSTAAATGSDTSRTCSTGGITGVARDLELIDVESGSELDRVPGWLPAVNVSKAVEPRQVTDG